MRSTAHPKMTGTIRAVEHSNRSEQGRKARGARTKTNGGPASLILSRRARLAQHKYSTSRSTLYRLFDLRRRKRSTWGNPVAYFKERRQSIASVIACLKKPVSGLFA